MITNIKEGLLMTKKVALVTGASQGIGKAIVERLVKDGFAVALVALNEAKLQQVADEINNNGGEALPLVADVANREEVFAAVEKTVEHFGDLNVIVNNAGLGPTTPIDSITPEQFEKVYGVNVAGVLWGIQEDITVNAFAPGIVKTPMMYDIAHQVGQNAGKSDEWGMETFAKNIAMKRLSEPEDVANVVSFLAGPDSNYVTGQTIIVDGGMQFH